jgi:uncharacterized membrane protein
METQTLGLTDKLRDNITALAERSHAERERAPTSDVVANRITGFTGSMFFVYLHLALFGGWIAVNLGLIPIIPAFDPTFVVLAMIASVEAIFLSTFVLISQNRMAAEADRRAELDLHISLLAEHELTRVAELLDRVARKLEVEVDEREFADIEQDVTPVDVIEALDAARSSDSPV